MDAGSRLPIYDEVVSTLLIDPFAEARHRLHGHDATTEEFRLPPSPRPLEETS